MPTDASSPDGPKRPAQRLGRRQRLRSPRLFDEAYAQGRKFVGRYMLLFLRTGDDAAFRLGVVTGRKIGGAVVRVRARRRLRELFRTHRARLRGAYDVVLIARAGTAGAAWEDLSKDFCSLARRAGILSHD